MMCFFPTDVQTYDIGIKGSDPSLHYFLAQKLYETLFYMWTFIFMYIQIKKFTF